MIRIRTLLLCLVMASPALGQTPTPPPATSTPPAAKPAKPAAAPKVPVVQAPKNAHAQKAAAKPAKPAPKAAEPAKPAEPAPAPAPAAPAPEPPAVDPNKGSVTGLPVPRFMSLRFDDVNLRVGPGTRYPIDWVYHRRDLPVEILRELEEWRLVQDQDNIRGWVRAPTLSPRRGVTIKGAERTLRSKPEDGSTPVALLKPGVVGRLRSCAAGSPWCEIEVSTYRGFVKRDEIFGVYPTEAVGG